MQFLVTAIVIILENPQENYILRSSSQPFDVEINFRLVNNHFLGVSPSLNTRFSAVSQLIWLTKSLTNFSRWCRLLWELYIIFLSKARIDNHLLIN